MTRSEKPDYIYSQRKPDDAAVVGNNQLGSFRLVLKNVKLTLYPIVTVVTLLGCNGGSSNNNSDLVDPVDDQDGQDGDINPIVLRGENLGAVSDVIQSVIALDSDLDGDLDVVALSNNEAWVYENISMNQDPQFSSPLLYAQFLRSSSYRVLYDLDGDGDLDSISNAGAGPTDLIQIWYEENIGSNENPIYRGNDQLLTYYHCNGDWIGSDAGNEHYLSLVDIDADGDLDLFIGEKGGDMDRGNFGYCENIGDYDSPVFAEAITPSPFGLSANRGINYVAFGDMDADGDQDAWVNHSSFEVTSNRLDFRVYENTGTTVSPSFNLVVSVSDWTQAPPTQSNGFPIQGCNRPHFADFNRDGLLDGLCPNGMNVSFLMGESEQ